MPENETLDEIERELLIDDLWAAGYGDELRAAGYDVPEGVQRWSVGDPARAPSDWLAHLSVNGKGRGANPFLQRKRNALMAFFYADGWTQQRIAEHFGIDQANVSRALRGVRRGSVVRSR